MKLSLLTILVSVCATLAPAQQKQMRTSPTGYSDTPVLPGQKWKVHDIDRPRPRMVTPGATPGAPPSDAIVLFNGKDLSKWQTMDKKTKAMEPAAWTVENGYTYSKGGIGDLVTKEKFGDIQLHLEFQTPTEIDGTSQWRANSGVLLMHRYEIQVLDSWDNPTYADGQAGAIYGQWPPLVNASKKPGEWQTYDILFEAPKFEGQKLVKPGYATVIHNGVMLHHHKEIIGRMAHRVVGTYEPHGDEEPLALQDHDTRVRFRNIWVRRITPYDQK
jgi:3-keto-disaccharide hydrolase